MGDTALLDALRRPGDEAQLTQALNGVLRAEPAAAADFVRLLMPEDRRTAVPAALACRAEEAVDEGRLDLRFTAEEWDVIVELKVHAGYGRDQLARYVASLRSVPHAYLAAVTRDDPRYGEAGLPRDGRWLGSVRWRHLLPGLRRLPFRHGALQLQWLVFLDILEREGSMGFTHPDPALFGAWPTVRQSAAHLDDFLKTLQVPLLQALNRALGGEGAADFYRGRGDRPVVSKSWNGIIDVPFRVPRDGHLSVRAGVFAYNPPTRFYVAPQYGRRLSARRNKLSAEGRAGLDQLIAGAFREYDVHAFLELSDELLAAPTFEEDVVDWAYARFRDLAASGLLAEQHALGGGQVGAEGAAPAEDEAAESG